MKKISYYHNFSKSKFSKLTNQERFEMIYNENFWESNESSSGIGSEIKNTKEALKAIKLVIKQYKIKSIIDIPCGDFNWLKETDLGSISYIGVDIVDDIVDNNKQNYGRENIEFTKMNILEDTFSEHDLILCRDLLVHFSFKDIFRTIDNIISSKSKFLLTTSFTLLKENRDIFTGNWRPINLLIPPFSLPKPIKVINEKCTEADGKFADKSLLLWKIDDLKKLKLSN